MDFSEKIRIIRERLCNNNNIEFAERMGEKPSTTSNWVSRGVKKTDIGEAILLEFPEVSRAWMFLNEGEMLKSDAPENKAPEAKVSYKEEHGRPFYPVDWTLGLDENIVDDTVFNVEFNIDFQPANGKDVNWYYATGKSMEGEIDAGSYVAMKELKDFSWIPLGGIYGIVTTNGMRTIKRIVKADNPDCYLLKSSNPDKENYPDQEIPKEIIKRLFRVEFVIKKLY